MRIFLNELLLIFISSSAININFAHGITTFSILFKSLTKPNNALSLSAHQSLVHVLCGTGEGSRGKLKSLYFCMELIFYLQRHRYTQTSLQRDKGCDPTSHSSESHMWPRPGHVLKLHGVEPPVYFVEGRVAADVAPCYCHQRTQVGYRQACNFTSETSDFY